MELLTEEEAREKWCPYSGITPSQDYKTRMGKCICSECMAWQWKETTVKEVSEFEITLLAAEPEKKNVNKGYCKIIHTGSK